MTGDTIARRMMAYNRDVQRIRLRAALARDAALCITQSLSAVGGASGEHSDKPGRAAEQADSYDRAEQARRVCFELETDETARLIASIPWPLCGEAMRRTIMQGESLRQAAAGMRKSEDSIRSLRRRGWSVLADMESELGRNETYKAARAEYEANIRKE